ncbi:MAG: transglycosylase SLT domain-containing protein [Gammaproteobacteria bacterium]
MAMQRRWLSWKLVLLLLAGASCTLRTVEAGDDATGSRYRQHAALDDASVYNLHCIAVLQGDNAAAYHLGWMRFSGQEVPADKALAAGWFHLAAKHGDSHSQRILEDLLPSVHPAKDIGCPLRHGKPDRATIEAWINVMAPGYGLDANLLLAVVEVESSFNPRARSSKNASGLMQLMPATASRFEVDDIWDPIENLRGGMAYLRWLMDRYEGDLDLSLAAYNAGEHVVNRYGGIPPYRETRDYVKTVNHIYNRAIQ